MLWAYAGSPGPPAALAALQAAADLRLQYDLAILDCQMPGIDGVMLARATRPTPPVLAAAAS